MAEWPQTPSRLPCREVGQMAVGFAGGGAAAQVTPLPLTPPPSLTPPAPSRWMRTSPGEEVDRPGPATPVSQAAGSWQLLAAVPHVLQSAGGSATEMR